MKVYVCIVKYLQGVARVLRVVQQQQPQPQPQQPQPQQSQPQPQQTQQTQQHLLKIDR